MFTRMFSIGLSLILILVLAGVTAAVWWFVGVSRGLHMSPLVIWTVLAGMAVAWLIDDIVKDIKLINTL